VFERAAKQAAAAVQERLASGRTLVDSRTEVWGDPLLAALHDLAGDVLDRERAWS
jgi:hypothetical protein